MIPLIVFLVLLAPFVRVLYLIVRLGYLLKKNGRNAPGGLLLVPRWSSWRRISEMFPEGKPVLKKIAIYCLLTIVWWTVGVLVIIIVLLRSP